MPIPKKFDLTLPLLKIVNEGQTSMRDAAAQLARDFRLSTAEQSEMLSTGTKTRFFDRVSWARVYLRQAGLLDRRRSSLRKGQNASALSPKGSPPDQRAIIGQISLETSEPRLAI